MKKKYPHDNGVCFWTLARIPIKPIEKVLFTDGKTVYGEAEFIEKAITDEVRKSGQIVFKPIKMIEPYPQPKTAPTRGFTYVEVK